ncbi:MAG: class I SAM-dependent rRNA methyltransferase [Candidatus Omnitrophica bacterium]|nr:class I SAM-dependent rRNA methyltransferase [Candidatus Omnitrophota bacterium]
MTEINVVLKPGKEKPVLGRHPWIFSGAIELIDEDFRDGDIVRVSSSDRRFLGKGFLSPRADIAVRLLTVRDEPIDGDFFKKRFVRAKELRSFSADTNAYRLINAEGDFLPGLVVDRYDDYLVLQSLFTGLSRWEGIFAKLLKEIFSPKGIYKKTASEETRSQGPGAGFEHIWGEECPSYVEIKENGHAFIVNIREGQKTGFFLDQRENRKLAGELAKEKRVLNTFAYTGSFSVYAAQGGASSVLSVESSESAIETAKENFRRNGLDPENFGFKRADMLDEFRKMQDKFDLVILDPPAFAKSKNHIIQASRGYKDINMQAIRHIAPDGWLMTFSCSSYVSHELFKQIIFAAAKDAGRNLQIIRRLSPGPDHPVSIFHPEGEYLKGLLCRVE